MKKSKLISLIIILFIDFLLILSTLLIIILLLGSTHIIPIDTYVLWIIILTILVYIFYLILKKIKK